MGMAKPRPSAETPDSQELCFISEGHYADYLAAHAALPERGDFVDERGAVLGTHGGIHRYTIGQRRGLGIPAEHRLFVTDIRPAENQVVLSSGDDLFYSTIYCTDPNWISIPGFEGVLHAQARFRHSKNTTDVTVEHDGDGLIVRADTPVRAPTPGQLAVFYHEDVVLGSAWIERAERA